jgi:hypothetical protein
MFAVNGGGEGAHMLLNLLISRQVCAKERVDSIRIGKAAVFEMLQAVWTKMK